VNLLKTPRYDANGLLDAGLSRYNTLSRYLDSTTKSPYSRIVVNQYLHRNFNAVGFPRRIFALNLKEYPL